MQTTMGRPAQEKPAAPEPVSTKLVEVEMLRKYCPFFLVRGDQVIPNDAVSKEYVMPGVVSLHPKDAVTALNAQAAQPTHNTYKGLEGV